MKLRPTPLGIKALGFSAVLVGAYYTTPYSNLFFLLLAHLACLGVLAVASARRNLHGVTARGRVPAAIPAGQTAVLEVELDAGAHPRDSLAVEVVLRGRSGRCAASTSVATLRGLRRVELETAVLARGVYAVESLRLTSTWPFGVVRAVVTATATAELVVHPAIGDDEPCGGDGGDGLTPAQELGRGQPAGLRDYRAGDELRSVDARASARRGEMVVAEWDEDRGEELHVLLDRRVEPDSLEHALRTLTALAFHMRERDEGFTLSSQGLRGHFGGTGGRPWGELWRWLAEADVAAATDEPQPAPAGSLRLGRGGAARTAAGFARMAGPGVPA